jgi:Domain of unknown function (DUF4145)
MPILVVNCPRCGAKNMTFDVIATIPTVTEHRWQRWYEAFSCCRHCRRSTVFVMSQKHIEDEEYLDNHPPTDFSGSLSNHFDVDRFISLADKARIAAPEHTPESVASAFSEASACATVQSWNGAGAMLRLAIDLATRPLLPDGHVIGLNHRTRRDLAPRVKWLIENGQIPKELSELAECIRQDGNDGVHAGTLTKEDVADLFDFATALFVRMYTEPEKLRLATLRRGDRRKPGE